MADSLLPTSSDYTDKDFDSVRRRLFSLIQSVFPTWTDTSVADFGNILVEMFAWCIDVLGFYQDNQALESRFGTAVQRKNLLALAKLINYEPSSAEAAQCLVRFTADPPPANGDPVILGVGSSRNPFPITVKTPGGGDDAVKFELQHSVTLTNAAPVAWGLVENSEAQSETFAALGLLGQEITLSRTPYLDGSASVTAGNGLYTEVESFVNSTATDLHYTVHINNRDAAVLRFGNQVSGALPSGTIAVAYKTGGGSRGNVEADALTQLDGVVLTESGLPATVRVLNEAVKATGGADRETEAQIKVNAPLSLRVLTRAVSREDFEFLAIQEGGMARALMLTNVEDPNIPFNTGHFYLLPAASYGKAPGFPTAAKMDEVHRRIRTKYPYMATFEVRTLPPVFVDVTIRARVFLKKGFSREQVKKQALAAYNDYFSLVTSKGAINERVAFGFYYETGAADNAKVLPLSDLQNALRDCEGIHRLGVNPEDFTLGATTDDNTGATPVRLANGSHVDVPIKAHEFPRFRTITLIDGATLVEF